MSPSSSTTSRPSPNSRPGSRPIDFREAARKSAIPLVLTMVGLAVIVASVPVALFAAGWLLASGTEDPPGLGVAPDGRGGDGPRGTGGGVGRDAAQSQLRQLPPLAQATVAQPGMGPDRPCHQRQRTRAPASSFVIDCHTQAACFRVAHRG